MAFKMNRNKFSVGEGTGSAKPVNYGGAKNINHGGAKI